MICRISAIVFVLVPAIGLPARSTAAPGKGDLVLPKNSYLGVRASLDDRSVSQWADRAGIGWPAKVLSVNGHWLQISDDGGYTLRGSQRAKYWVSKDDMLSINDKDTPSTYGSQIDGLTPDRKSEIARLHWLRGICWQWKTPERFPEPKMAIDDFHEANVLDYTVADAWLRRGRLLAEMDALKGQASWESFFKTASAQFVYANSRKATKQVSAHASGGAAKLCNPSVTNCSTETLPPPSDNITTLIGWSKYAPPQLYFEVGRAYQHLADACWPTAKANKAATAESTAKVAADKAEGMKHAAEHLANDVRRLRRQAARVANEADQVAKNAIGATEELALRAAARAETIAAKAEVDAAKAETAAANAETAATEAKAKAAQAELDAETAKGEYKECFIQARTYFRWAGHSNPTWYRPPAAEAELFLARTKKDLTGQKTTKWNGWPVIELCAHDLIRAAELYSESIRIYDQFDEAYRGRAEAFRLLATAPGFTDSDAARKTLRSGSQFLGLLAGNSAEKYAEKYRVLDLAYESAKAASFLTNDRDAKNLETRGKIETDRASLIGMNVGLEYFAQAGETLKDAMAYSRWTSYRGDPNEANRNDLNEAILETERQWSTVLADFAAYNDGLIARVSHEARRTRKCLDRLSAMRVPLDARSALARPLAAARRAIEEVENFNTTEQETREHEKTKLRYDEPWFVPLPTRGELVNRNSQTQAWDYILKEFADAVDTQLDEATPAMKAKNPQFYEALENCRLELSESNATSARP